jgi:hypothetical protein
MPLRFFWPLLAVLIGFALCGNPAAQPQPPPQPQHAFWEALTIVLNKTWDDPVAFYTFVLAVFTGILGASTIGLWIVTAKGIRNQARDTEILERAYLSVDPGGTEFYQDRRDRVVAKIIIRNVGHLPARNVRFCGEAGSQGGQADDFPIKELFPGKIILAPGAVSMRRVATIFDRQVGNSTYVWGIVTYDDGFGNSRFTRFCHRYPTKASIQQAVELLGEAAQVHEYGNDAD